jgi:hypothetical protein
LKSLPPKHIVFLHIPKAGGTTLRDVLQRQYSQEEIFEIGEDINGDIKRFRATPAKLLYRKRLLIGHMSHGLDRFFPGTTICLTMLRHPVARVYSEYRFLSSNQFHPLYPIVAPLNYHQYLEVDPTRQAGNGQTRLLSGSTYGDQTGVPGIEPLHQAHLTRALDHLKRHYPIVGLLERFDESLMLWCGQFNWRYPLYEKKNITKRASRPLDDSEIEHTLEKNRFDVALYKQAVIQFEENLKKQPQSFQRKLTAFKLLNKSYQKTKLYGRAVKQKMMAS